MAVVAIIGRPNVGKSTLFNRIAKKNQAIIEDVPGVTRDRNYAYAIYEDKRFFIIDTGGFDTATDDEMIQQIRLQATIAIEEADVALFLMDGSSGLHPVDYEIAKMLRRYEKKTFYVVNKIDGETKEKLLYDFYELGLTLYPLSALNGNGFEELMDEVVACIPETQHLDANYPKIAVIGRPNVGKSSLVNALLGKERMIVSDAPGTTRDAIDSICRYYKDEYLLIDTAGIRRKGKMSKSIEKYAFLRTATNIARCDVALIMINSEDGVVDMDKTIAGLAHEAGKGAVLLVNKWDLIDEKTDRYSKLIDEIKRQFWFIPYAPILTVSALTKQRVTKIFSLVNDIIAERKHKIKTSPLNDLLLETVRKQPPPMYKGKKVRLNFISQIGVDPPAFALFANYPEAISDNYLKYLDRSIRAYYPFTGTPIRFYLKEKAGRRRKTEG
jgi:GTP-binding protein